MPQMQLRAIALETQREKARAEQLEAAMARGDRLPRRGAGNFRELLRGRANGLHRRFDRSAHLVDGRSELANQAAENTAHRINSIATATEELSTTVQEMRAQTAASAKMTSESRFSAAVRFSAPLLKTRFQALACRPIRSSAAILASYS